MITDRSRSLASWLAAALNVIWYLLAGSLVIVAFLAVAGSNLVVQFNSKGAPSVETPGPSSRVIIPVSIALDGESLRAHSPSLGIADAQFRDVRASLAFSARRDSFGAANLALAAGMIGLAMWIVRELRNVLRTVRDGTPFVRANARRIQRIAWLVIAGELARTALMYFETSYAAGHFQAGGIRFEARPDVNLAVIFNGLIVLVIAEVFRTGTQLEEDQSLTV
jgi:hypothetical protein